MACFLCFQDVFFPASTFAFIRYFLFPYEFECSNTILTFPHWLCGSGDCWELDTRNDGARWHKRKNCRPLLWHRAIHSQATGELVIQGGLKRSIVAAVTWRVSATHSFILCCWAQHFRIFQLVPSRC